MRSEYLYNGNMYYKLGFNFNDHISEGPNYEWISDMYNTFKSFKLF